MSQNSLHIEQPNYSDYGFCHSRVDEYFLEQMEISIPVIVVV